MAESSRRPRPRQHWRWGTIIVILAAYILTSYITFWRSVPIDDAFIGFRYARNLASGQGLVFNAGERVEGYSSLSWALLLAAGNSLGFGLPELSKWLGLLLGAGTLVLLATAPIGRRTGTWAAAMLAVHLPFLYHQINGLETSLMTFLVTGLVCLPSASRSQRVLHHAFAVLIVTTRPEGVLLVVLWYGCLQVSNLASFRAAELKTAGLAVAAFGAQTVWRVLYYGDWIANSARAKMLPPDLALPKGLVDLLEFVWQGNAFGALLLLAIFGTLRGILPRRRDAVEAERVALMFFILGSVLLLASSGGDSFPMWRFYIPIVPILCLGAARGLEDVLVLTAFRHRAVSPALGGGLFVSVILALWIPVNGYLNDASRESSWVNHWAVIGQKLAVLYPSDTKLAADPVGALPFYSGFATLDMLGLTDPHIARSSVDPRYYYPGHQRHDGAYVVSRRPDLIMLANGPLSDSASPVFPWRAVRVYESDVLQDSDFAENYVLIHVPLAPGRYAKLFASREFARRNGIAGNGLTLHAEGPKQ